VRAADTELNCWTCTQKNGVDGGPFRGARRAHRGGADRRGSGAAFYDGTRDLIVRDGLAGRLVKRRRLCCGVNNDLPRLPVAKIVFR
jgi:hypothetical protein